MTNRPDRTIADLATRQRGVVTRRQLLAVGITREMVQRRLEQGRLHRFPDGLRGAYLVGHRRPLPLAREQAALLVCRADEALLSHRTALQLWGLGEDPGAVDVTVVGGGPPRRAPAIVGHAAATLPPADRRRVAGLPVVAPARTIRDLAAGLTPSQLGALLDRARAGGVVRDRELAEQLRRSAGRRGAEALRRALADAAGPGFSRSEAERRAAALIARVPDLPRPRRNARLLGVEVDLLWAEQRVVVEVDGFAFHGGRRAFERDRARDATLTAHGYRVVRVTWRQLRDESEAFLVRLALLLRTAV
ncbi:type IV toxin-antitoxin system AbiEi family antitoxin domain-containing protein [Patulibacter defluvii]|uniref:type IV toxin-antitoxin system AbiEi family antitoxin domain-containing protein n=1 Tax=Patulibacter defluvii TaxID=3095358 RepID=UPI002A74E338|nr:type IV toxin-antitoxin system AbiEi family antitoxin domain-containing protein [Patulibacter sp. DM4]